MCWINCFLCQTELNSAEIWILWVPVTEQKDSIGYSDNSSSLSAQIEKKAPTSKQLQALKETMNSADWDESDDNLLFNLSSVSRSSGAMLDSMLGNATDGGDRAVLQQPQVQQGNRKGRRGAGGGGGTGVAAAKAAPTGHTGPNLALEAAKFKKNSVKDRWFWQLHSTDRWLLTLLLLLSNLHHCSWALWTLDSQLSSAIRNS